MKTSFEVKWHQITISLLVGFALGVLFSQWQARDQFEPRWKKGDMKHRMEARFNRELGLSPEQSARVREIFESRRPQMAALHDEMRPKFEALRNETQEEIRSVLNPEQQKKFEEMSFKMEEHRKGRRAKWHPPFPGPEEGAPE